jgi:hypothetical protein
MDEGMLHAFKFDANFTPSKVTELQWHPRDSNVFSVSGPNGYLGVCDGLTSDLKITVLNIESLTEGEFDPKQEVITWTSHAWTTESKDLIVAVSDEGHLLVVRPLTDECIMLDRIHSQERSNS